MKCRFPVTRISVAGVSSKHGSFRRDDAAFSLLSLFLFLTEDTATVEMHRFEA